jgi:hypothetical protein
MYLTYNLLRPRQGFTPWNLKGYQLLEFPADNRLSQNAPVLCSLVSENESLRSVGTVVLEGSRTNVVDEVLNRGMCVQVEVAKSARETEDTFAVGEVRLIINDSTVLGIVTMPRLGSPQTLRNAHRQVHSQG